VVVIEQVPSLCQPIDDLTLSGPKASHSKFWSILRRRVQLEDPVPLSKVIGHGHVLKQNDDDGIALRSADFAKQ